MSSPAVPAPFPFAKFLLSVAGLLLASACSNSSPPLAGAAPESCEGRLYCDDFESYAVGAAPAGAFSSVLKAGTVAVDDGQHFSGTRSVKFDTVAQGGTKSALLRLTSSKVFPLAGNAFYGRMMFLLDAAPATSVHWTFIQAGGLVPGESYHALYRYGGQLPVAVPGGGTGSQLMASYDTPDSYSGTGPGSDCYQHANGTSVPVGVWSCVEWHFDGGANQLEIWLDGTAIDALTVNGTGAGCVNQPADYPWTAPEFDHLDVGWESYQTDAARTLHVDDLVLASERVGCPSGP